MATILLSAVGAAVGSLAQGTVFGLTGAVIGRAVGATLGRVIDQRLLGSGSAPIETGRTERFRITGAGEGAPVARLFGRMRLGGHVIWATEFLETTSTTGGGKGRAPQPKTTSYAYSVSLAVALCEGEISRVGRIWADGVEIDREQVAYRVYRGTSDQMPDPLLEAVEGAGNVPAYRGLAYIVFEDLPLAAYGNRVPQFAVEVVRPAQPVRAHVPSAADSLSAVALMPGTGEYALATTPVTLRSGLGGARALNVSAEGGVTDFSQSLAALRETVPGLASVSLIYSWFGNDLRAGQCLVKPKVERHSDDGANMPWRVGGLARSQVEEIARIEDRPVYGGTPTDQSVIEAITAIKAGGEAVTFYPFLLMEILAGNAKPDPYGADEQAAMPWRGRITGSVAPGLPGSTDRTAANATAVATFFGTTTASQFSVSAGSVTYSGPASWGYRRFILHAAALCKAAGGVEAFCIGSEMRGMTQMRDETGFPAIVRLRALAAEVRLLLPDAKLTYAADWTEYSGYQPQDGSGDLHYPLDALWADDQIDAIGIDNYMPLSDWREGLDHADAAWGEIHDLGYLKANIEGGEGFDWSYSTSEARAAQRRDPITDGAEGEPWVYAYKALNAWWSNPHYIRSGGIRRHNLFRHSEAFDNAAWLKQVSATIVADAAEGPFGDTNADRLNLGNSGISAVYQAIASGSGTFTISVWARALTGSEKFRFIAYNGTNGVAYGPTETLDTTWRRFSHSFNVAMNSNFYVGNAGDNISRSILIWGAQLTAGSTLYAYTRTEAQAFPLVATEWVPKSKPIWFTEFGCAAIDKGTNQPNRFLDPKSDESGLPLCSNGRRDDLIQAQYLRATMDYWRDPANNPVSPIYGAPMLDMDRAHAWAWDARPWPAFPNDRARWADGENWARGHWLTGRLDAQPLDLVVAEICESAGVTAYDVSRLFGLVRGHLSGETESARARLQPLMLAYGFHAVERDGLLVFLPIPKRAQALVTAPLTALDEENRGGLTRIRAPDAETVGRLRLGFTEAERDYGTQVAEAVFPGDGSDQVSQSELPLALTRPEAQGLAERWLAEARVAQDALRFALPPSTRSLGAGSLIETADGATWRIDRVEDRGARIIDAIRVEPTTSEPSDAVEEAVSNSAFIAPLPVTPVFLDLPLLTGDEVPHAPHLAVIADPWPGTAAVYSAPGPDGYELNRIVDRPSVAGVLETPLVAAKAGLWDRGAPLRVRIETGALSSAEMTAALNGVNVAAIGSGDDGEWEVIQFADATLVGPDLWEIGLRLRGQQGSDAIMPAVWPEGSLFVLLDGAVGQVDLPGSARGLQRHWRIGPARRSLDDASYSERVLAFQGIGLRPLSPVHLRSDHDGTARQISWIRRSRIDADTWDGVDVPLGEESESYLLRISDAGTIRRTVTLSSASFAYTDAMRSADGTLGSYSIDIAQISERFGPGPFARIDIDD